MSSTFWKAIIPTIAGTIIVMLVLEIIGGWWYLHLPAPTPYAPQSASTTPAFLQATIPSSLAGADFARSAHAVAADLQTVQQLNTTILYPFFGDTQIRFFQSNYAGALTFVGIARDYAQQGTTLATKLTSDIQTFSRSASTTNPQILAQVKNSTAVLQEYASALSTYYAALHTMLSAYPFATAKETTAFQNAGDTLTRIATDKLVPELNNLLSQQNTATTTVP